MISSVTRLGATALLASVLISSAMPASATLTPCQKMMFGVGGDPEKAWAMRKAVANWRVRVQSVYGGAFPHAKNSEMHCKETGGFWNCRWVAQPCAGFGDFDGGVKKNPVTGD